MPGLWDGSTLPFEIAPGLVISRLVEDALLPSVYHGRLGSSPVRVSVWDFRGLDPAVPEDTRDAREPGFAPVLGTGRLALARAGSAREASWVAWARPEGSAPLREWRARGRRPSDLLEIGLALARAVSAAHERGRAHGALGPDAIEVTRAGEPMIYEAGTHAHGLAVAREAGPFFLLADRPGRSAFLAPEALRADGDPGPLADVWGVAAVLFWLLTGEVPCGGAGEADAVRRVLAEPARPLRALAPHESRATEAVLARALAKNPRERFPSVAALAAALAPATPREEDGPGLFLDDDVGESSSGVPVLRGSSEGRRVHVYLLRERAARRPAARAFRSPPDHLAFPRLVSSGSLARPRGTRAHFLAFEAPPARDDLEETARHLGLEARLGVGRRLVEAMAEAHAAGAVHGALAPSKIDLVGGTVRIREVGLAAVGDASSDFAGEGAVVGHEQILYVAPELLSRPGSEPLAPTADVHALGAILFWLVARRAAFVGAATPIQLWKQIAEEVPPRLRTLVPECPPAVEAAVARALEKKPKKRFRDAGELARALG